MASYLFSTITDAQAAAMAADDALTIDVGAPTDVAVLYTGPNEIDVVLGGRTVAFNLQLAAASQAGHTVFTDGTKLLIGDAGDNKLSGNVVFGGAGADTITGNFGHVLIQANGGDNSVTAISSGFTTLYGGQGDDYIVLAPLPDNLISGNPLGANFVQANKGNDTIIDTGRGTDIVLGGQGDDVIQNTGGNDYLDGNLGNDSIISAGNDQVFGEGGNDTIQAAAYGTAIVHGGDGDDVLQGGAFVYGDAGNDSVSGGGFQHPQTLDGGDGDDFVFSLLFGQAVEYGGAGNDTLSGLTGPDTMDGGTGDDRLVSNVGGDVMQGGDGADTLVATGAANVMSGGAGADRFELRQGTLTAAGADRILDWSAGDTIHFTNAPATLVYSSTAAADFTLALAAANQLIGAHSTVVAVQVGADVIVFAANASSQVDVAVDLVGRSLADVDVTSFV